jgi:hypothetical protein
MTPATVMKKACARHRHLDAARSLEEAASQKILQKSH